MTKRIVTKKKKKQKRRKEKDERATRVMSPYPDETHRERERRLDSQRKREKRNKNAFKSPLSFQEDFLAKRLEQAGIAQESGKAAGTIQVT